MTTTRVILLRLQQSRSSRMEPINYSLMSIPDGREGIRATLKLMSNLVRQYKGNPDIRELALKLTGQLQQKNFSGEVKAIHAFVREKIRYVKDIRGIETIQTPLQTLRLRAGDCDDKSTLVAALLESIGHPTRLVAVGFSPNQLSHVLVQTKLGSKWVWVECTEPVQLGWMPPRIKSFMVQHN